MNGSANAVARRTARWRPLAGVRLVGLAPSCSAMLARWSRVGWMPWLALAAASAAGPRLRDRLVPGR